MEDEMRFEFDELELREEQTPVQVGSRPTAGRKPWRCGLHTWTCGPAAAATAVQRRRAATPCAAPSQAAGCSPSSEGSKAHLGAVASPSVLRAASPACAAPRLLTQDKGKRPVVDDDQGYSSSDEEEDGGPYASDGAPGSAAGGAEGAAEAAADGAGGQPGLAAEDSEPGDLTCAICLNNIPLENLALIKVRRTAGWLTWLCLCVEALLQPGAAVLHGLLQRGGSRPVAAARPSKLFLFPLALHLPAQGCDHMYCATCILHWALHKPEPWCPQCKQPFDMLLTYRTLDGELQVGLPG